MKRPSTFRMLFIITLLLAVAVLAPWGISHGADYFYLNGFDTSLKWKATVTLHFRIYYHEEIEAEAFELARIAEKVHKDLVKQTGWKPRRRTDVVLTDNMDLANGSATPFPFNRIIIYLYRPETQSLLGNFDNWLEIVFTHEYTHILNLDTVHGIPACSRFFPGRVYFPNIFQPIWLIEGNAVYQESIRGFGRNNSTCTDMIMRMEVLSGNFKSISEASCFPRRWPRGSVPYLYGGLFVNYLEENISRNSISAIFHENADNVIPYLNNRNARQIYGSSFNRLWNGWRSRIENKYRKQAGEIKAKGLTDYRIVSDIKTDSTLPRFGREGISIYFVESSDRAGKSLKRMDMNGGGTARLCRVNSPVSISPGSDNTMYYSDIEFYRNRSLFNEAFSFRHGKTKITTRLRANHIDIFSNGERASLIRYRENRYTLALSDLTFTKEVPLIRDTAIQLSSIRISPDGKRCIFTIRDQSGNSDIALMEIDGRRVLRITVSRHSDIEPAWHPDGTRILFSSDRTGIYNLYEYDIKKNTLSRLTSILGGAFQPDVSPDGRRIAFSSYEAGGHAISLMDYPAAPITTVQGRADALPPDYFSKAPAKDNRNSARPKSGPYNPLHSLMPSFILPIFPMLASEEIYPGRYDGLWGFTTFGWDTLQRHAYSILAYSGIEQKRVTLDINYTLRIFYPDINIGYRDETLFYGDDTFPWQENHEGEYVRELSREINLGMTLPWITFDNQVFAGVSCRYEKNIVDLHITGSDPVRKENLLARVRGSFLFNNAREYIYSISPEHGRAFSADADLYTSALGSDLTFYRVRAEHAEYLPSFVDSHVLMLRIRGGISINSPDYLDPYPLGRFAKGDTGSPSDEEEGWGLRGYPAGTFYGSRLLQGAAEYRLPVFQRDSAPGLFPLMLRDIWLTLFVEYGNVWNSAPAISGFRSGAGVEMHTKITAGYALDITGYAGYARGFGDSGEDQVYFAVGTMFEGAAKGTHGNL